MKFPPASKPRGFATELTYAGIGNRDAPEWAIRCCRIIAFRLMQAGYTLRTGGAPGCDQAFLSQAGKKAEVYVPWRNFEGFPMLWDIPTKAYEMAVAFQPSLNKAKISVVSMHARNMMQVLGPDLLSRSDFVVCYTANGRYENYEGYTHCCGTDSAITCARANGIPVINLGSPGWAELLSAITEIDFLELEQHD